MKPHRFDTFAKKLAAPMMAAVRGALEVFSGDHRYHWPMKHLFGQLRMAEDLARDMLREIAGKLFVSPLKMRIRSVFNTPASVTEPQIRAPYFRLESEIQNSPDADKPPFEVERLASDSAPERLDRDHTTQMPPSKFETRLAALDDVLAHPGKHAARMARALYRADNEASGRLTVKSEDDLLIDNINEMISAHETGDADTFATHYKAVHPHIPADDTS